MTSARAKACAAQPASDSPEAKAARLARQLAVLGDLTEAGLRMALLAERQAVAQAEGAANDEPALGKPFPDPGLAFARLARAVRQTIALAQRLDAGPLEPLKPKAETAPPGPSQRDMNILGGKAAVEFIVARAIETEREPSDAENLLADLAEKLDDPADDEAFAELPVGLLVAVICHELGLAPDWELWADESWVHDARAARFDDPPAAGAVRRCRRGVRAPAALTSSAWRWASGSPGSPTLLVGSGTWPSPTARLPIDGAQS